MNTGDSSKYNFYSMTFHNCMTNTSGYSPISAFEASAMELKGPDQKQTDPPHKKHKSDKYYNNIDLE